MNTTVQGRTNIPQTRNYECNGCDKYTISRDYEFTKEIKPRVIAHCPVCGSEQTFSMLYIAGHGGFHLPGVKGSGWHATDYATKGSDLIEGRAAEFVEKNFKNPRVTSADFTNQI